MVILSAYICYERIILAIHEIDDTYISKHYISTHFSLGKNILNTLPSSDNIGISTCPLLPEGDRDLEGASIDP